MIPTATKDVVDQIKQQLENVDQIRAELKQLNKTDEIDQIATSKTKINEIFNDISTILNTRKHAIMKEIDSIKSDTFENNDEKKYLFSRNIEHSDDKRNTDEYYDYVSIWIKNKQALQYMDKDAIKKLHEDIMENVFGGMDKLLKQMLIHPVILDIKHSNKLHEILSKYSRNSDDLFANYRNQNKFSITSISDDCLSYIMKFIGPNGRYVIQQCCRLFAVIARKHSSLNNLETDLELLGMVPHIAQIIQGIESNDNKKNVQAMELYAQQMDTFEGEINIFLIRGYWSELWNKFAKMVAKDSSDVSRRIALKAGVHTMYPALLKLLKKTSQMGLDDDTDDDDEKYESKEDKKNDKKNDCSDIIREMGYDYNADVLMQNKETIPLLCKLLNSEIFEFDDIYDKKSVMRNICKAISNIVKFDFVKYNQMFIDCDLLNILCNSIEFMEIRYEDSVWIILVGLLNTKHITIDLLLSKSQLSVPMIKYPQKSIMCLGMVIKCCTHDQRMEIIHSLGQGQDMYSMTKETKGKLLDILNMINDEIAFNKLNQTKTFDMNYINL